MDIKEMTKEEFEQQYCKNSGITIEQYHNEFNLITLPCKCDYEKCKGWAAVTNEPMYIRIHNELNMGEE